MGPNTVLPDLEEHLHYRIEPRLGGHFQHRMTFVVTLILKGLPGLDPVLDLGQVPCSHKGL